MPQPIIKTFMSPNHVLNAFGFNEYEPALRDKIFECFVAVFKKTIDDMDPAKNTGIEHIALDQIYIGIDICNMAELNPKIISV